MNTPAVRALDWKLGCNVPFESIVTSEGESEGEVGKEWKERDSGTRCEVVPDNMNKREHQPTRRSTGHLIHG